MNKIRVRQVTLQAVVFCSVLSLFLIKPFLNRRDAGRTVEVVLRAWEEGDTLKVFTRFEDAKKSPPIDSLSSYKITQKVFAKKDGKNHARFHVVLNFPDENIFPSGKEWIFELTDTLGGWKITDFYQADRGNIPPGL